MEAELEVPEGEALSLVSTPTENKEHMKEEESIVPTETNCGLRGDSVPGKGGTGGRWMDGAARRAAEGKEGRPRGRREKRWSGSGPPTSARRRYISSNGTSSWTKYDRGERLPNTPMCTSAVPSALHTV